MALLRESLLKRLSSPNSESFLELHEPAGRRLFRQEAEDFSEEERQDMCQWLDADERHEKAYLELAELWGQLVKVVQYQINSASPKQRRIAKIECDQGLI